MRIWFCVLLSLLVLTGCAPTGAPLPLANSGAAPRRIMFSRREWIVKASESGVGPGPNLFSDSAENVWVDDRGRLHLRITYRDERWWCAEVIGTASLGLGTYTYRLAGDASTLDPQAVLGLFTWDDDADAQNTDAWHSEIDVEISRWGQRDNRNAQFVVQPYTTPENIDRFELPAGVASEHQFTWRPDSVLFASRDAGGSLVHSFTRALSPPPARAMPRINLWLLGGQPPQRGQDVQVIIERFAFAL